MSLHCSIVSNSKINPLQLQSFFFMERSNIESAAQKPSTFCNLLRSVVVGG
jgi:hypothetical protein